MDTIQTTAARRHDGGARWRWLRRKGLGAAGLLALSCLSACGPNVTEPPKVQEWMLGAFSHRQPVDHSDTDEVIQYHVYDTLEVSALVVNINGLVSEFHRVWEPRGEDSFAMFPAEEELDSHIISEYLVRPEEGASVECGPYEVIKFRGPESSQPGAAPNPETIHRGAVCARPYDCTPPPDDPDACWGLAYTLEWCDEPPPPCEGPDA
jgi:hypothetical protein